MNGPESHPAGRCASWLGDVVCDALHKNAPADPGPSIEIVDLKAHMRAWRKSQLRAGGRAENDDAFIEEVVDGEDQRA